MGKFLLGLATGVVLVILAFVLLIFAALRFCMTTVMALSGSSCFAP